MPDLNDVRSLSSEETGRATVRATQSDGRARAMARDGRIALFVRPDQILGNGPSA